MFSKCLKSASWSGELKYLVFRGRTPNNLDSVVELDTCVLQQYENSLEGVVMALENRTWGIEDDVVEKKEKGINSP